MSGHLAGAFAAEATSIRWRTSKSGASDVHPSARALVLSCLLGLGACAAHSAELSDAQDPVGCYAYGRWRGTDTLFLDSVRPVVPGPAGAVDSGYRALLYPYSSDSLMRAGVGAEPLLAIRWRRYGDSLVVWWANGQESVVSRGRYEREGMRLRATHRWVDDPTNAAPDTG